MKLKTMTASFGKLDGKRLELGEGLNIIQAPNEGGKSTWAGFLKAMLYGIDTRDRDKKGYLADKNRYQPWSGAPMEGEITLEWQGRDITIRRSSQRSTPFAAFSAVYTGTEEPVPELDSALCGELLVGAGREVYERSAFIGQSGVAVTTAPELEKRIAALAASGEEDVSYSQTEGRLRDWLNRRKVNKTVGLIPKLEGELAQTEDKLARLERTASVIAQCEEERAALEKAKQELEWEREVHRRLKQRDLNRRFAQSQQEFEVAQAALDSLRREQAKFGPLPERDLLKRAQGELQYLKVLDEEIKQGELALAEAEVALERTQAAVDDPRFPDMTGEEAVEAAEEMRQEYQYAVAGAERARKQRWSALLVFVILAVVLGVGRTMFPGVIPSYFFWLMLPFYAVIAVLSLYDPRYRRKEIEKLPARWKVSSPEELISLARDYRDRYDQAEAAARQAEELRVLLAAQKTRREGSRRDLLGFVRTFSPEASDLLGCSAALSRALGLEDSLRQAQERADLTRRRRDDLEAQGGQPFNTLEMLYPPENTPEQTQHALAQVAWGLSQVERTLAEAQGEQRSIGDPAALAAQKEELQTQLERRKLEHQALTTALEALKAANARLQERFSPELNRLAGEWMDRLTGGKYAAVSLNRELEASAAGGDGLLPRRSLALSQGTADQLYLAVRLAICQLCLPKDSAPLVLDDALVSFDDERLASALDCLAQLGKERQILLFTCQGREAKALAGRKDVNIISL